MKQLLLFLFSIALCSFHATAVPPLPVFRGTAAQDLMLDKKSKSSSCISNLKQIGLAATLWSVDFDNGYHLPSTWQQFTNQIPLPKYLYCPADTAHPVQTNWASVDLSQLSYQIVSPGVSSSEIGKVFAKCSVHENRVLVDGFAQENRPYENEIPAARTNSLYFFNSALQTAKTASLSLGCSINCNTLGNTARNFAFNNGSRFPTNFNQITNQFSTPRYFFCPANLTNIPPASFSQVNWSNVDYTIVTPGAFTDSSQTFIRCRLHHHTYSTDGYAIRGTNFYPPRIIVGHPISRTAEAGSSVTLSVLTGTAPGLAPFSFQWRKKRPFNDAGDPFTNTVVLTGATNSSLTFTNVQSSNEGYYDVAVRDATGGFQDSFMAYLRVEPLDYIETNSWQALACTVNLRGMNTALRMFQVNDVAERYPTNLAYATPYFGWPLALHCPSDTNRTPPTTWSATDLNNTSYTYNGNIDPEDTTAIVAVCKVHGYTIRNGGTIDTLSRQMQAQRLGNATVLTWTNAGCLLQVASSPGGPFSDVPGATSPFTNSAPGGNKFYRIRAD